MKHRKTLVIFVIFITCILIAAVIFNGCFLADKTNSVKSLQDEQSIVIVKIPPNESRLSNQKTKEILGDIKLSNSESPSSPLQEVMFAFHTISRRGDLQTVNDALKKVNQFATSPHYKVEDKPLIDYYRSSLKSLINYSKINGEVELIKKLNPSEKALAYELKQIIPMLSSKDDDVYDRGMNLVMRLPTIDSEDYSEKIAKLYDKMFALMEKREGVEIIYRKKNNIKTNK